MNIYKKLFASTMLLLGLGVCCSRLSAVAYIGQLTDEQKLQEYPDAEKAWIEHMCMEAAKELQKQGIYVDPQRPSDIAHYYPQIGQWINDYYSRKGPRIYIFLDTQPNPKKFSLRLQSNYDTFDDLSKRVQKMFNIYPATYWLQSSSIKSSWQFNEQFESKKYSERGGLDWAYGHLTAHGDSNHSIVGFLNPEYVLAITPS